MKLLILGSTGGTGRQLVEQALAKGHHVTAFVRNPAKLTINHRNLRVVQGDLMDAAAVRNVVPGHDAVLSSVGAPATKTGVVRSAGTLHVIQAMEAAGVERFVCQTSLGYGNSVQVLDQTPFFFKYIIVPLLLKKGFADHQLQEEHIKSSKLQWIIARPGNLTDGPLTGIYKRGFEATDKDITVKISRADVADFMLKQLTGDEFLFKTPGLSY